MSADLASKIKSQIEFYFSGLNLKRDKFMRETMAADPEGFISMQTLLTFNRLKQLTTDEKTIVDAIKDSDKLSFNSDFTKVKSNVDSSKPENDVNLRTVHVRGLPRSATIDDLLEGLKPFGNIRFIEMRRIPRTKEFKGSVNVEFTTKEEAESFVGKSVTFAGMEITDKMLLNDCEKLDAERARRYTLCKDSLVQFKNIGSDATNEDFREFLKPLYTNECFLLRREGDNSGVVRFMTSEDATKAMTEFNGKEFGAKPLRMSVLRGNKATFTWTRIRTMMMTEDKKPDMVKVENADVKKDINKEDAEVKIENKQEIKEENKKINVKREHEGEDKIDKKVKTE